jgi:excisionase family DNA binding protein
MNITELPHLYTEDQVAAHLDVNPETLARARRAGKLPSTRVGNRVRYTAAHIAAYLEQQECGSTSSSAKTTSGTSAGPGMDAQTAHQLAREIAKKPNSLLLGTSSKTTGRKTNG